MIRQAQRSATMPAQSNALGVQIEWFEPQRGDVTNIKS